MSLDRNLFTLNVVPNESNPAVQDLVLPSGTVHYHKEREAGLSYRINLFDPMSQSMLASATAPHATSKHKTIELYNPSQVVEFKSTGTLTFRWSFSWEEHTFEWKRESCYLIRKPDPAVLVAIRKEVQARFTSVQILHYNLNRFDIADRKGLEITLLTTLLTFQDMSAANNTPSAESSVPSPVHAEAAPPLPPRPAPKTGVDRVAEMHAMRYEPNEVTVDGEGSVENYGEYAEGLLADDAMLFITVRSASPADVPKVLQVVEHVKRLRHKQVNSGKLSEELHQYVIDDNKPSVGLHRIKLDDPPNAYTPPSSLTVHLSKIPMPELRPQPSPHPPSPLQWHRQGTSPRHHCPRRLRRDRRYLLGRRYAQARRPLKCRPQPHPRNSLIP
ncbi:hypothetical protein BGY98DRAFT_922192 [Russula aff. rugulosa BPL654]|nr:hypothetical protein BGY98DRAFT_922192 [Russula aff. rugulosa BPL654]